MNMIGHPKHVQKCLDVGVDLICAQGGEGGGHTGDVPTTVLIPAVAALVRGKKSPLTGEQVQVVAAGGLFNGQSVAAALMLGANAVWIGTRFIMAEEAGASRAHQDAVKNSGFDDNVRTIIFTVRRTVPFAFPLVPPPLPFPLKYIKLTNSAKHKNTTGPSPPRSQQPIHQELGRKSGTRNQRSHVSRYNPRRARH